jgi:cytochrome b
VWDLPVRVFHWLLALSFAGAWLTAESERWRDVHVTLGYTMAALVAFRLVWGVVGTRHARFASFVRSPSAVGRYLRSLWRGRPDKHVGHNPAGAIAIVALLALIVLTAATGWATLNDAGGHFVEEAHEAIANGLLVLVAVHLIGVVASSWLHRENLVGAMIHGRKRGPDDQRIRWPLRPVAALVLAAVVGFWWTQWDFRGGVPAVHAATASARATHDPDHD